MKRFFVMVPSLTLESAKCTSRRTPRLDDRMRYCIWISFSDHMSLVAMNPFDGSSSLRDQIQAFCDPNSAGAEGMFREGLKEN